MSQKEQLDRYTYTEKWRKDIAPDFFKRCCQIYGVEPEAVLRKRPYRHSYKEYLAKKLFYIVVFLYEYDHKNDIRLVSKRKICEFLDLDHCSGVYYEANYFPNSQLPYEKEFNQNVKEMTKVYNDLKNPKIDTKEVELQEIAEILMQSENLQASIEILRTFVEKRLGEHTKELIGVLKEKQ